MNIIFGPVNSRRFGESLGVDLSPQVKQCNYDCLYCELEGAKTQEKMIEVLQTDEIIKATTLALKKFPNTKCLTITANGEPTLYPHLYELMLRLEEIKGDAKTLLLTNGSMLWDGAIARACVLFDKVKFSLDAISPKIFARIDRAHSSVDLERILKGIYDFKRDFGGELYAEILFVEGINDTLDEVKKMAKYLMPLFVKRLDLNTVDRPPAHKANRVDLEKLNLFQSIFTEYGIPTFLPVRVKKLSHQNLSLSKEEILKTLALRPMSNEDVESLWDEQTKEFLQELQKEQKIKIQEIDNLIFYRA